MMVMLVLLEYFLCVERGTRGFSWTVAPSDALKNPVGQALS